MQRTMGRVLATTAVTLGLLATTAACSAESGDTAGSGDDRLVIASWGGAFSEATRSAFAEPFFEETGIKVEVLDTGNHVATVQAQAKAGAIEWDLLDSATWPDAMILDEEGLLEHWPEDLQADLVDTYGEAAVTEFGHDNSGYGLVLVCNRETVEKCPTTVEELFDPEAFPGKRMLPGDPAFFHQLVASVALSEGADPKDLYGDTDVAALKDRLASIADDVSVWWTSGDQQNQALLQGEADMGMMYSGRAYQVLDEGVDLDIFWDGLYVTGSMSIVKDAPNSDAALEFIEWMRTNPEAQAKWSEMMFYAAPHPEIYEFLPEDVAVRLATYPDNFEKLAIQDMTWIADNKQAMDDAFLSVIGGS